MLSKSFINKYLELHSLNNEHKYCDCEDIYVKHPNVLLMRCQWCGKEIDPEDNMQSVYVCCSDCLYYRAALASDI